jgi:hypothetical protein
MSVWRDPIPARNPPVTGALSKSRQVYSYTYKYMQLTKRLSRNVEEQDSGLQ